MARVSNCHRRRVFPSTRAKAWGHVPFFFMRVHGRHGEGFFLLLVVFFHHGGLVDAQGDSSGLTGPASGTFWCRRLARAITGEMTFFATSEAQSLLATPFQLVWGYSLSLWGASFFLVIVVTLVRVLSLYVQTSCSGR